MPLIPAVSVWASASDGPPSNATVSTSAPVMCRVVTMISFSPAGRERVDRRQAGIRYALTVARTRGRAIPCGGRLDDQCACANGRLPNGEGPFEIRGRRVGPWSHGDCPWDPG